MAHVEPSIIGFLVRELFLSSLYLFIFICRNSHQHQQCNAKQSKAKENWTEVQSDLTTAQLLYVITSICNWVLALSSLCLYFHILFTNFLCSRMIMFLCSSSHSIGNLLSRLVLCNPFSFSQFLFLLSMCGCGNLLFLLLCYRFGIEMLRFFSVSLFNNRHLWLCVGRLSFLSRFDIVSVLLRIFQESSFSNLLYTLYPYLVAYVSYNFIYLLHIGVILFYKRIFRLFFVLHFFCLVFPIVPPWSIQIK